MRKMQFDEKYRIMKIRMNYKMKIIIMCNAIGFDVEAKLK